MKTELNEKIINDILLVEDSCIETIAKYISFYFIPLIKEQIKNKRKRK